MLYKSDVHKFLRKRFELDIMSATIENRISNLYRQLSENILNYEVIKFINKTEDTEELRKLKSEMELQKSLLEHLYTIFYDNLEDRDEVAKILNLYRSKFEEFKDI